MAQAQRKGRRRASRRRAIRTIYGVLVVLSAFIVSGYALFHAFVRPPEVETPTVPPAETAGTGDSAAGETPALPDATAARERKDRFYTFLLAASDQVSGNSDTIMVCSYDVPKQRVSLVSVPRDTLVNRKYGTHRYYKINSAYSYGGIEELKAAVSDMLGIPIDFYVTVDLKAFVEVVDAVGGVDFEVPINMNYDAPDQDLHIHYDKGLHRGLSGQQVLEIARCRKNSDKPGAYPHNVYDAYDGSGTNREATQRALMVAIARKLVSWNSLTKISHFVDIFNRNVQTNIAGDDMLYFATSAMYVDLDSGVSTAVFAGDGSVSYKGWDWCWEYDPAEALRIVNTMLNPYTTDLSSNEMNIVQAK